MNPIRKAALALWHAMMEATDAEFAESVPSLAAFAIDVYEVRKARARRAELHIVPPPVSAPDLSRVTEWPSTRDDADRFAS